MENNALVILAAVSLEVAPLRKWFGPWETVATAKPLRLERCRTSQGDLYLGRTGMGPQNARRSALALLEVVEPRAILSVGLVGALDPALRIGDLVLGSLSQQLLDGKPATLDTQRFALGNPLRNKQVADFLAQHGMPVACGSLVTSPRIVESAEEKRRIAALEDSLPRKLGVDMETAALACAFEDKSKAPLFSLRSVSDLASEDLAVDFDQFNTLAGKIRPWKFFTYFLKNPDRAANLVRLVKHSKVAANNLAKALRVLIEQPAVLGN